jgi:hypothetical protein
MTEESLSEIITNLVAMRTEQKVNEDMFGVKNLRKLGLETRKLDSKGIKDGGIAVIAGATMMSLISSYVTPYNLVELNRNFFNYVLHVSCLFSLLIIGEVCFFETSVNFTKNQWVCRLWTRKN